MLVQET